MGLDLKDKKLLNLLEINSRMTLSEIAKHIGLSREAVNYRINRLVKSGVINSFYTVIDFNKLGYSCIAMFLKLRNLDPNSEKKMFEELDQDLDTAWLVETGGKFDLIFEFYASDFIDFNKKYDEIILKYSTYILYSEVVIRSMQTDFPRNYIYGDSLLPDKIVNKTYFNKKTTKFKVDHIDKKILFMLSSDTRITNLKISQTLNIPLSTISNRIKKLEQSGIIKKYTILISPEKVGYQRFKALIYLRGYSLEKERMLFNYAKEHPNIYYFVKGVGRWNIELEIDVPDLMQYQKIINEIRNEFKDMIHKIEFVIIFREIKQLCYIKRMALD